MQGIEVVRECSVVPRIIVSEDGSHSLDQDGTPIHYTNFLRRVWHKVQDLAKVRRRTPHDLRHTWASHMLAAGADLAYVSAQLGHANPSITLRTYSHWVPGTRRVATSILDTKPARMPEINSHRI
jgi:integrase